MNKDKSDIDVLSRIRLQSSPSQIISLTKECKCDYLPDRIFDTFNKHVKALVKCLECAHCKKVPLALDECKGCKTIVCKKCSESLK